MDLYAIPPNERAGMQEPQGHRGTHRELIVTGAGSRSMMYASVLAREELRIMEELISRFDRATPRQPLREGLILARSEIVAAMKRAPEELEERSPLAQIVYSHCLQHRRHHLEQLRAWVASLGKTL